MGGGDGAGDPGNNAGQDGAHALHTTPPGAIQLGGPQRLCHAVAPGHEPSTAGGHWDVPGGADRHPPSPCSLKIDTSASCLDTPPAAPGAAPHSRGSSGSSAPRIPGGALLDLSPVPIFGPSESGCIPTAINFARSSARSSAGGRPCSSRCSDRHSAGSGD
eukprot:scaffold14017_cov127-Isochrysis_galbana.AAC.1